MIKKEYNFFTKEFWAERKYAWWALFVPIYLTVFFLVEKIIDGSSPYWSSYVPMDDAIPFVEWFVIPYYFWYPLLVIVGLYGLFKEGDAFKRYMKMLCITFFAAQIFFLLVPNGQDLRPEYFENDNVFTRLIGAIYSVDTNTNVFPSIHVIGSLDAFIGVLDFKTLKHRKICAIVAGIVAVLISVSAVFIKQHSILDIAGGIVLTIVGYVIVYILLEKRRGN